MGAFRAPAKTEALSVADITTAHGMSGHRALPLERQREPQTRHTNSPITAAPQGRTPRQPGASQSEEPQPDHQARLLAGRGAWAYR